MVMEQKLTLNNLKEKCFKKNWDDLPMYARIVTFRFSIRLVNLLYQTPVTPNQVTVISLIVAFLASVFFSKGDVFSFFLGAILLECYYVLDCVDGQLARLKGKCSKEGAFSDYLLNYIVHPLVFFSIGMGCFLVYENYIFIYSGILSAWMILLGYALSSCSRAVVLGALLNEKNQGTANMKKDVLPVKKEEKSLFKKIFAGIHKISTYPTIMNIITVTAIIGLVTKSMFLASLISIVFAVNLTLVFVGRWFNIMRNKKITAEYETIREAVLGNGGSNGG